VSVAVAGKDGPGWEDQQHVHFTGLSITVDSRVILLGADLWLVAGRVRNSSRFLVSANRVTGCSIHRYGGT
jgi:hypothetical protein